MTVYALVALLIAAPASLKVMAEPVGKSVAESLARLFDKNGKSTTTVESVVDRDSGYGPLLKGRVGVLQISGELEENDRTAYGITAVHYADLPVAIVTHAGVGKRDLTQQQVCDAFSGRVKNWKQLGGPELPIAVQARTDSLTLRALRARMPCFAELEFANEANFNAKDDDMRSSVEKEPGALGFVTYPEALTHRLMVASLDGQTPLQRSYPVIIPLALVLPGEPSALAKQFVALVKDRNTATALTEAGVRPAL